MVALRSEHFAERVLWHEGVEWPRPNPAPLPRAADAVVVGGGYAGLSAARTFAELGHDTVLLEADPIGVGASTRNGGMVIPELKAGPEKLAKSHGDLGRRLYADVNEAFDHLEALIRDQGIDCDYSRTGQLYLAHSTRVIDALRETAAEHARSGEDVRFLAGDDLSAEIGSDVFPAGILFARTGSLQPAKFHAALVRMAIDAGAAIHANTRATAIADSAGGSILQTSGGTIRARHVVIATNATADDLLPQLKHRVVPIGSFIIATEVLEPGLAASTSPGGRMMVDSRNLLAYWRLTPDGRLAFGGRKSLDPTSVASAADFLYDSMLRVHPQLEGTTIEFAWGGEVAMTVDRLPHAGRFGNAWYLTGCNGSGVALMPWLGSRLASAIHGDSAFPAFAELRHRPVPLDRFRSRWLPLVGRWYAHADRTT